MSELWIAAAVVLVLTALFSLAAWRARAAERAAREVQTIVDQFKAAQGDDHPGEGGHGR